VIGFYFPSCSWDSTSPIVCPDASTFTLNFSSLLDKTSTGYVVIHFLSLSNAFCSLSFHFYSSFPFSWLGGNAM